MCFHILTFIVVYQGFHVLSLKELLTYLKIVQLCTTWSGVVLCVFYGDFIHVLIPYVDEVYFNLKIYLHIFELCSNEHHHVLHPYIS
jgi:hypothetical protein